MTRSSAPSAGASFPATLHIPFGPSPKLAQAFAGVASMSLILLAFAPIPEPARWLGIAFVVLWGIHALRAHHRTDLRDLVLNPHGIWQIGSIPGAMQPALLLPTSVVLPWLVILRFTIAGQVRAIVLTTDNAPPEAMRRLRVVLRMPRS